MTTGEPFLTWNLFATVAGLPTLGWWLGNLIKKRDQLQEENLKMWQEGAKERMAALCGKIDALSKELKSKVDSEHCHERHDGLKNDINDLKSKLWT